MFDIGGLELLLIAVVGLLVLGPERLPEALRTLGLWLGRLRRSFMSVKNEIEKEIGMDEVRRQLHNEAVMDEMKRIEKEVEAAKSEVKDATEMNIDPNAAIVEATGAVAPEAAKPADEQPAEAESDAQPEPEAGEPVAEASDEPAPVQDQTLEEPPAPQRVYKDEHDLDEEWRRRQEQQQQ